MLAGPGYIPQGGGAHAAEPFPDLFLIPGAMLWPELSSLASVSSFVLWEFISRLLTAPRLTPGSEHSESLCSCLVWGIQMAGAINVAPRRCVTV